MTDQELSNRIQRIESEIIYCRRCQHENDANERTENYRVRGGFSTDLELARFRQGMENALAFLLDEDTCSISKRLADRSWE